MPVSTDVAFGVAVTWVGPVTVIESGWVSVRAAVSVTLTVNEEVPPVVGVPVIAPVEVFSVSPAGSEPPGSIDQVVGNVPPVACKVAL